MDCARRTRPRPVASTTDRRGGDNGYQCVHEGPRKRSLFPSLFPSIVGLDARRVSRPSRGFPLHGRRGFWARATSNNESELTTLMTHAPVLGTAAAVLAIQVHPRLPDSAIGAKEHSRTAGLLTRDQLPGKQRHMYRSITPLPISNSQDVSHSLSFAPCRNGWRRAGHAAVSDAPKSLKPSTCAIYCLRRWWGQPSLRRLMGWEILPGRALIVVALHSSTQSQTWLALTWRVCFCTEKTRSRLAGAALALHLCWAGVAPALAGLLTCKNDEGAFDMLQSMVVEGGADWLNTGTRPIPFRL